MPGRRNKNQVEQQEAQEPQQSGDLALEKVSQLEDTINSRFQKFEELMMRLATQNAPDQQTQNPNKRPAPEGPPAGNTRNKASRRPPANPPVDTPVIINEQSAKVTKPTQKKATMAKNAAIVDMTSHTPAAVPSASAQLQQNVNMTANRPHNDPNYDMNAWLLAAAPAAPTFPGSQHLPMSAKDFTHNEHLEEQVSQIIESTANTLARGNVRPGLFPYKYVRRGPEKIKATINSVTPIEHLWAIFRIINDEAVQPDIKPYLLQHIQQILEDARDYDWATAVRPWSEEVFSLIAEGRLPQGWRSTEDIKMLRVTMSRASTARLLPNKDQLNKDQPPKGRQQSGYVIPDSQKGGSPCINFNGPQGCPQQSGHFINGRKVLHICAFCLWNTAVPHPHSEHFCRNKQRFNSTHHF